MIVGIAISVSTCFLMIVAVIKGAVFPRSKVPLYPFICLLGALLLLILGVLPVAELKNILTTSREVNPLKILVLFFSMSALSVYLDEAGFFRFLAVNVLYHVKKKQLYLFFLLYITVSVLTVFTSNDIVILTFTPFLCYFCKSARISPIPYLFAEFVAANTFSMLFVIGNPTNIYLSLSAEVGFMPYLKVMWFPTLCGGVTALLVMLLMFRKQLRGEMDVREEQAQLHKTRTLIGGVSLIGATVMLIFSDLLPVGMWQISFFFAALMFLAAAVYKLFHRHESAGIARTFIRIPWTLLPFVLSMFVVVSALNYQGICAAVADRLSHFSPVFSYGITSTLAANIVNNIPMSVFFGAVLEAGRAGKDAVFATVIGSNIGAYLTPIGALAGIMWSNILGEQKVRVTFLQFCLYGVLIAVPTLLASLAGLWLSLRLF